MKRSTVASASVYDAEAYRARTLATVSSLWRVLEPCAATALAEQARTSAAAIVRTIYFLNSTTRAAAAAKLTPQQVYDDIRANLVPGATLMPTGVFATLMAQEAGCSLMRST